MSRVSAPARPGTQAPAAAPLATLPQGFAALATSASAAKPTDAEYGSYLWWASSKSGQWADMKVKLPGLLEHDLVYVSQDHCEILRTPKYHLVNATQYWARKDPKTGQPMSGVSYEAPASRPQGVEEYIDAVVMVQVAEPTPRLLPARVRFKSGLVGAVTPALRELETVRDDMAAWANRSPAHADAAKVALPAPCFRFVVSPSFAVRTAKSGFQYLQGKASCAPVSPQDARLVVAAMGDDSVRKLCETVAGEHEKRLADVKRLPA